jgi:hypothetical protein
LRLVSRAKEILIGIDITANFPPQRVAAWARMALYEDHHGSQPLSRIYSTILEECNVDGVTFQAILNDVVQDSDCGEKGGSFNEGMCDAIRRWLKANNRWTDAHDYKVRSLPAAETRRKTVRDLWEQCKGVCESLSAFLTLLFLLPAASDRAPFSWFQSCIVGSV